MDHRTAEQVYANRIEWAEALENGKYAQVRGALCRRDGYCCLGVAQALRPDLPQLVGQNANTSVPSREVMDEFGLSACWSDTGSEIGCFTLSVMNDVQRRSFAEIAAYIRGRAEAQIAAARAAA